MKIADFGLSRNLENVDDYYRKSSEVVLVVVVIILVVLVYVVVTPVGINNDCFYFLIVLTWRC